MSDPARLRAGQSAGQKRLDLRCGLTEFPREIFELADTLEVLDLSGNALSDLPHDLHRLHRLRVLFCSGNRFTHLPDAVGRCSRLDIVGFKANRIRDVPEAALPASLRWLILTDNDIEALPDSLARCTRLQKLMLAGNRLEALPDGLAACRSLELLRISANRFGTLPPWLLSLPRLSWLAFAGNPMDAVQETAAIHAPSTPDVAWSTLSMQHRLGEGASGVIHQARWQRPEGGEQTVAVKLFKGAVTSDGWPHSEMAACIGAGRHPNLIGVLGQVSGHPEGAAGLVLERVDAGFTNLAGPPSLASCTRDVYGDDAHWTPAVAQRLARGIASAVAHLHARGVLHGDLYAHNILRNAQGDGLLGDFGAASFMPDDAAQALALQRVEARAFGCLLEELLARARPTAEADGAMLAPLQALQQRCLRPTPAERPAFAEIVSALDGR